MSTTDSGTGQARSRRTGTRLILVVAVAAALVAAVLLALTVSHQHGRSAMRGPMPASSQLPSWSASPPASSPPSPVAAATQTGMPRSVPVSVWIPKIDARSSLVPLGLNTDGSLQTPPVSTPMQAGWYDLGPTPGQSGPAVIVGHVDGDSQEGIFYHLRDLAPGDTVVVARKDGLSARFVVQRLTEVPKDQFPTDAVYGPTSGPELRLITCGGSFDSSARSYRDNIIVYAQLASP